MHETPNLTNGGREWTARQETDGDSGGAGAGVPIVAQKRTRELTWEEKAATVLDIVTSHKSPAFQLAQGDCSSSCGLIDVMEKDQSISGSHVGKHTGSCDSDKNGDSWEMRDVAVDDQCCPMDVEQGDNKQQERDLLMEQEDLELTWEEKVVEVLHIVRCRGFTEYNHKLLRSLPTRFCTHNIAFFDLDKESKLGRGPPVKKALASSEYWRMMDSVNVILIKVTESDVSYPISIFGTVLARDVYDYRRGRDDAQIITSPEDTLLLTGPNRALAASDNIYFEFHLKIKGDEGVDKDFSKGLLEHSTICYTKQPMTLSLESLLSTIEFVYTPVPCAVEASVAVNIKGLVSSKFSGKVTAWTSGDDENKIILYDSEVKGTNRALGPGGSIDLTRRFVAVKLDDTLVLNVSVSEGDHHEEAELFELVVGHDDEEEECIRQQGPYELQVKVVWTAGLEESWRRSSRSLPAMLV
uniref:DUF6598 domain-containing protein n=1 Tax=Oryza glumipatula TaxID=40148 RepID=A0A0E0AYS9_9ORYZ